MTNKERRERIATYKKEMHQLMREFMKADDIATADKKLNEMTALSRMVAELKDEIEQNSFFTKFKKRLGL